MSHPGKVFSIPQADFVAFIVDQMGVNNNINMLCDLSISSTIAMRIIRTITAREIFQRVPSVKKALWEGEF